MRDLWFLKILKHELAYVLTTLSAKVNEKVALKVIEIRTQTYQKTNDGPMKRLCSTIIVVKRL